VAKAIAATVAIAENGNGTANQKESPSSDGASTSLVDTSSASDFASLALNLTGLQGTADERSKPTSGSVTVSAYSLIAAARGVALTNPEFYERGINWRRLSLTLGSEESKLADHFTDKPATNFGVKLLLINGRDVYSRNGKRQLANADVAVGAFQDIELHATNDIQCAIFYAVTATAVAERRTDCRTPEPPFAAFIGGQPFDEAHWPTTLAALQKDGDSMKAVNAVIARLARSRTAATTKIVDAVDQIRKARQLSIAYYTKRREDNGTDEHRAELIFDWGLSTRLNWTVNASLDHRDRKLTDDTDSGRLATEFQAKLSSPDGQVWNTRPVILSGSGEASKDPDSAWLMRTQLKLVVPIASGVDVPIAYTFTNRNAEGVTSGSQLKFSLAIDPVRLSERFR
jgi:hypothetical protein